MIKNVSTLKLLGILATLVLIYLAFEFFGESGRSKNYREVLVEIDTAKIDKIVIEKSENSLQLIKTDGNWKVETAENKFVNASGSSVKATINVLLDIKSSRIVAKNQDKWREYQVDSAGTRVQIFEGKNKSLDIILGRFGFRNQREYSTYVRLADENEVYAADNFMGMSINTEADRYRNTRVLRVDKDSVSAVVFSYPDSSFTLTRDSLSWQVNGQAADSAATAQFLNSIAHLNGSDFYDEDPRAGQAQLKVGIKKNNGENIEIRAWKIPEEGWIIQSDENPDSYFADKDLYEKLFKEMAYFKVAGS